jgi:hypothetical protein
MDLGRMIWISSCLERTQEIHEIIFLLLPEPEAEPLVVEIHHIEQGRGRAVVEIRSPRGEPTQNWAFQLPDVGALSGNQRAARIGDLEHLPGERPLRAGQGEYR